MSEKLRRISVFSAVIMIFCIILEVVVSAESIYASIESAGISVEIPQEFNVTSADTDVNENVVYNLDAYMNDTSKKLSITAEKNNITENMYNFKYNRALCSEKVFPCLCAVVRPAENGCKRKEKHCYCNKLRAYAAP